MKAAVWYNNKDIRIENKELPNPKSKEILVKVNSCGICGSDIVEWYRLPRAPLVQGHELGGEIFKLGSLVEGFKIGDRIFAAPKIGCGKCKYCLKGHASVCTKIKVRMPGAFAEYVLLPQELVENAIFKLPNNMSYETATFIEPLACVIRAQKLSGIKKGDTVLIIGTGISGLLHVKLAVQIGAIVTALDINQKRLDFAKSFGAKILSDSTEKFDHIILCAASLNAFESAWKNIDFAGNIILYTVPSPDKKVVVPVNDFWRKEVRLISSYYCDPDDLQNSFELLSSKKIEVDDMITHRLSLQEIQKGFDLVSKGGESLKIIINPSL